MEENHKAIRKNIRETKETSGLRLCKNISGKLQGIRESGKNQEKQFIFAYSINKKYPDKLANSAHNEIGGLQFT